MLTTEQVQEKMVADETLAKESRANSLENYRHGFDPAFLDALVALRQGNVKFFNRAIEDEEFRRFIADNLISEVYCRQRRAN
jgi:type I restriction enzyme, R subunit